MRHQRVRLSLDAVEVEREPGVAAGRADPRVNFRRSLRAAGIWLPDRPCGRCLRAEVRVQLKRMPADGDFNVGAPMELRDCRLDVAFADVAPRADDVGNDVNVEREVAAVAVAMQSKRRLQRAVRRG